MPATAARAGPVQLEKAAAKAFGGGAGAGLGGGKGGGDGGADGGVAGWMKLMVSTGALTLKMSELRLSVELDPGSVIGMVALGSAWMSATTIVEMTLTISIIEI